MLYTIITFLLGSMLLFPKDTMPIPCIIASITLGIALICISLFFTAKAYEKHVLNHFHLHFISRDGYHRHRHIKAYSYAARRKAIHDLAKDGYILYAETEITKEAM